MTTPADPYLLTPGPLTTAASTKAAMLRDWGSWDADFRAMTAQLRRSLLDIAGDTEGEYDCVPLQGSGSYCGFTCAHISLQQPTHWLATCHIGENFL